MKLNWKIINIIFVNLVNWICKKLSIYFQIYRLIDYQIVMITMQHISQLLREVYYFVQNKWKNEKC